MSLREAWPQVRDCIVAIAPKRSAERKEFPDIIGTGFLASANGIVCTCRHVADAFDQFPRGHDDEEGVPAAIALIFRRHRASNNLAVLPVQIRAVGDIEIRDAPESYRGERRPDVAFLYLAVTDTPYLRIGNGPVEEGEEVGIGGFPMGTDLLRLPGWLHQLTPTLMRGIVSAVLPHDLHPTPHGILVHAQTVGGSSGSPVFRRDGSVVGMVWGGPQQCVELRTLKGDTVVSPLPTSLTGCVSRDVIVAGLLRAEAEGARLGTRMSLHEYVEGFVAAMTRGATSAEAGSPTDAEEAP